MYKKSDFKKIGKYEWKSKDCKFLIYCDSHGFFYPCGWFFQKENFEPSIEKENFYSHLVHTSYDYSFSFVQALEVLNMVIEGTWQYGKGRFLNGLETGGIYGAITNFSKIEKP